MLISSSSGWWRRSPRLLVFRMRFPGPLRPNRGTGAARICSADAGLVGERRDLPDLSALLPGFRRGRDRRPGGDRLAAAQLEWLGVDGIWLSPIYPSPLADYGYDVSDHSSIAPEYGTFEDFDLLLADAHGRGIRVLLDLVVSHTSIEHPWFREHPERYSGRRRRPDPPNNWLASFGGSAWSRDERSGRLYLHSFFPEQPDLDWRCEDVRVAMAAMIRGWTDRGVDGFRVDAIDRVMKDAALRDDPPASEPFPLPSRPASRVSI